jgi:tetratricopeptide (TPR) repeat protein
MAKQRLLFLLGSSALLLIGIWQLPFIAQAVPSRYVALLPPPLQRLTVRQHPDVLPTAAAPITNFDLLRSEPPLATASLLPPTVTPLAPDRGTTVVPAVETATPAPSETPPPAATTTATPILRPRAARLEGITHYFQTWNNCGPATLAMALSTFGVYRTQQQTAAILKPDPEDRNVSPYEMAGYVNDYTEEVAAFDRANGNLEILRGLLAGGWPVIIELGINPPGEYRWMGWYGHYLLVVAYDDDAEQFWVYDSWFGTSAVPGENATSEGRAISYLELDRQWREFNRNYIVLYRPEDTAQVAALIGPDMDDSFMWRRALPLAQSEVTAEADDAFLWFNLGTVYSALEDYEKAAAAFDQARAIGLPWRMLWYQFGPYEAYYQTGRYEDVIILADVTLDGRPYFEESYYYRGLAQAALGDIEGARRNLSRAVAFNPNFTAAVESLEAISEESK